MRTIICSIALAFVLYATPSMAQSSRRGGGGIMSGSHSGHGSGGNHHTGGYQGGHYHNGGHTHSGFPGGYYGNRGYYSGYSNFGFGGLLFGGGYGYPGFYYGSSYPYYSNSYYSSTILYPPYVGGSPYGGTILYGSEVPITYLPMKGAAPAQLNVPVQPQQQAPAVGPALNNQANLPAEVEQLDPLELVERPARQSSLENRLRARQEQLKGDLAFREQDKLKAHGHYRQAAEYAEDLASVQFRLAVSYSAMGKFDLAVAHIKRVLELEPTWPGEQESLTKLYGSENVIARNSLLIRLSQWVGEDIRDPDRLLLIGAFLYEDSRDKAREFLQASTQLSGDNRYTEPFLNPKRVTAVKPTADSSIPEEELLDLAVPPLPNHDEVKPPDKRTVPVPPLPGTESPDGKESSETVERFIPKDLGFTHPRHGGGYHPTTTVKPVLEGPRFPVLGN